MSTKSPTGSLVGYITYINTGTPMTSDLIELMEAQGSDGILEMMADRDGSAFLLDRLFASMDETEVAEWTTWLKTSLKTYTSNQP